MTLAITIFFWTLTFAFISKYINLCTLYKNRISNVLKFSPSVDEFLSNNIETLAPEKKYGMFVKKTQNDSALMNIIAKIQSPTIE